MTEKVEFCQRQICSKCREAARVFYMIEGPSLPCAACWQAILAALQGVEKLQRVKEKR